MCLLTGQARIYRSALRTLCVRRGCGGTAIGHWLHQRGHVSGLAAWSNALVVAQLAAEHNIRDQ